MRGYQYLIADNPMGNYDHHQKSYERDRSTSADFCVRISRNPFDFPMSNKDFLAYDLQEVTRVLLRI